MLKNRFFSLFAVAALVGLAACETEPADDAVIEETNVDATAPVAEPAPVVVEPTTPATTTDTMGMGTTAPVTDTATVTPQP